MSENSYSKSGVNIDKGKEAVNKIRNMAKKSGVMEIGKFSGFYPMTPGVKAPVLVSSADGVGTKLKVAFMTGKHNTVGKDLVNHCINDILVYGAKPLFFLDYIATGVLEPDKISDIVSGILEGCIDNEFILLGGETAEMPGFYKDNEYDIAGFIVGIVEKEKIIDGKDIHEGDLILGLPSTGLHTNGYSLARQIIFDKLRLTIDDKLPESEETIGDALLKTHRSYLKPVSKLIEEKIVKGLVHITGGGFYDNIPRVLPENLSVKINQIWPIPEIFSFLINKGNVSKKESYRVFNMGIGMILFVDRKRLSETEKILKNQNESFYIIGQVTKKNSQEQVIIS